MANSREQTQNAQSFPECVDCGKADSSVCPYHTPEFGENAFENFCEECYEEFIDYLHAEGYVWNNENARWISSDQLQNQN